MTPTSSATSYQNLPAFLAVRTASSEITASGLPIARVWYREMYEGSLLQRYPHSFQGIDQLNIVMSLLMSLTDEWTKSEKNRRISRAFELNYVHRGQL